MEIKVFCSNCKVEILRAETDILRTPLIGSMFKVKKDMEWSLFSPHDTGNDLICPMCDWAFHENGKLMVAVNGDFVIGKPEVIIPGIVACEMNPVPREPVIELMTPKQKGFVEKVVEAMEGKEIVDIPIGTTTKDPTIEGLQEKVEGTQLINPLSSEEKPTIPVNPVVESIQETPEKEPEKHVQPQLNQGDWSKSSDTDEHSEMSGKAPPGTVATDPIAPKKIQKRGKKVGRARKTAKKVKEVFEKMGI